jgi:hypothetical protein
MSDTTTAPPGAPLRIDHLSKHFGRRRGRVTALDDVSLQFPARSVAVLATATIMASLRAMPGRRG